MRDTEIKPKRQNAKAKEGDKRLGNEFSEGRPTDYKKEYDDQVYKLCLLGATTDEIANFFEVTKQTILNWEQIHKSFFDAVRKGKIIADAEVAKSFHKRAVGYEYKETYFEKIDNKLNLELTPDALITTDTYKKKIVVKELPADPGASLNWLKNRQPEKWRDKQDIEHSGNVGTYSLTKEERELRIQELIKKRNAK